MPDKQVPRFDLDDLFKYHPPEPDQIPKYNMITAAAKVFAEAIIECTEPGPFQSVAIRHVIDARMNANASVAFKGRA